MPRVRANDANPPSKLHGSTMAHTMRKTIPNAAMVSTISFGMMRMRMSTHEEIKAMLTNRQNTMASVTRTVRGIVSLRARMPPPMPHRSKCKIGNSIRASLRERSSAQCRLSSLARLPASRLPSSFSSSRLPASRLPSSFSSSPLPASGWRLCSRSPSSCLPSCSSSPLPASGSHSSFSSSPLPASGWRLCSRL